jgi:hypothetical protein
MFLAFVIDALLEVDRQLLVRDLGCMLGDWVSSLFLQCKSMSDGGERHMIEVLYFRQV